jgi:hypothetical protein
VTRLLPLLALSACIDAAWDDYCAAHNSCTEAADAGCTSGSSADCPAASCLALSGQPSGLYWIDARRDGGPAVDLLCDMQTDDGGWTLVATTKGVVSAAWLVSDQHSDALTSIDAVPLALASSELRLSGTSSWVKWPLPTGRTAATLWRHTQGPAAVAAAPIEAVTATAWNGTTQTCFQSSTGIAWRPEQGGAYPASASDDAGTSVAGDLCLMVGTVLPGASADGFTQADGGPGFDAPTGEADWPNLQRGAPAQLEVWLR